MSAAVSTGRPRDDAVNPELKWIGVAVFIVLLVASLLLYLLPAETGKPSDAFLEPARFAWPVKPEMTAMFMGSCYGAGAYFFYRTSFGGSWHAVAAYFPGISVFAWLMGIATFLHWDKFNHDHVAFLTWLFLYVTTPFLVPLLYLRNRRRDPGVSSRAGASVPGSLRRLAVIGGGGVLALAAVMYVAPSVAIEVWPWPLTELTSRVIATFLSASGTAAVMLSRDSRWSAWRISVQCTVLSAGLLLVAGARAWDQFDAGSALSYVFLAGMAALVVGGVLLDRMMETRRP